MMLHLDFIKEQKLLQQGFFSTVLKNKPNKEMEYIIILLSTSEKVIPKSQLFFVGNLQGNDLVPYESLSNKYEYLSTTAVGWENQKYNNKFEEYIIEMYLSWQNID